MKILITGGAGCLGSNLVEKYIAEKHQLLVIDNFATSDPAVLPANLDGLEVVNGHIADEQLVKQCFEKFQPSHVIHSAAAYKDPMNWQEDTLTNVSGTIVVAKLAEQFGVKRIINFQTALCYGRPDTVPIPISHPEKPFTSYGISKTAGERYLQMCDVPVVSLRLANICAPRLAIGPIPTFYQRLKQGKDCFCSETVRDFLDISDFFALMDRVILDDAPTGIYNVSTGEGHSIKEIYDEVSAYLQIFPDKEVPIVPPSADDVPSVVLDPTETEKVFQWKAEVNFRDTIGRMLSWYDKHGVSAVYSHLSSPKDINSQ